MLLLKRNSEVTLPFITAAVSQTGLRFVTSITTHTHARTRGSPVTYDLDHSLAARLNCSDERTRCRTRLLLNAGF